MKPRTQHFLRMDSSSDSQFRGTEIIPIPVAAGSFNKVPDDMGNLMVAAYDLVSVRLQLPLSVA